VLSTGLKDETIGGAIAGWVSGYQFA